MTFIIPFAIASIVLADNYLVRDEIREQIELKENHEKEMRDRIAKEDSIKKENQKKDSIAYYIVAANKSVKNGSYLIAIKNYKKVLDFSPKNKNRINFEIANLLFKLNDYKNAINSYNELGSYVSGDTINYQIALCYIAMSDKKSAVQYLKREIETNSEREFYNYIAALFDNYITV